MKPRVLSEDQAFKLLAFLVTSARLCVDEPENYGSFRLIDAASRLLGFLFENEEAAEQQFYGELQKEIESKKLLLLTDEESYAEFLIQAARDVARHMKTRLGKGGEGTGV